MRVILFCLRFEANFFGSISYTLPQQIHPQSNHPRVFFNELTREDTVSVKAGIGFLVQ